MQRRVTIRDIAKAAGVHFTTVSRALAKHPSIPDKTCERIARIAAELEYAPDPMVSALSAYRTQLHEPTFHGTLAWVSNAFTRNGWNTCPTFDSYYKGAAHRAEKLGYKLDEFWLREPGVTIPRFERTLAARNIRGLIFSPQPSAKMRIRLNWDRFASVTFGRTLAWPPLNAVSPDCFSAMQITVRHLRSLGYRRIGLALTSTSDERVNTAWSAGFLAAQRHWQRNERLAVHMPKIITAGNFLQWLKAGKPDAVISQELWLLNVLETNGYTVPQEIGFATPTVTSYPHTREISGVDENAFAVGESSVDVLVGMIHRGEWGIPAVNKRVFILGSWTDGSTLVRKNSPARKETKN